MTATQRSGGLASSFACFRPKFSASASSQMFSLAMLESSLLESWTELTEEIILDKRFSLKNSEELVKTCASTLGLDWTKISQCHSGSWGDWKSS